MIKVLNTDNQDKNNVITEYGEREWSQLTKKFP